MVGEGGGKLTFLAGIEPVHVHMYENEKKKCYAVGSNHKKIA